MAGTLNDASGALARMEASGLSAVQARGLLERLVDVQAATTALIYFFGIAALVTAGAAWLVWFGPRPKIGGDAAAAAH